MIFKYIGRTILLSCLFVVSVNAYCQSTTVQKVLHDINGRPLMIMQNDGCKNTEYDYISYNDTLKSVRFSEEISYSGGKDSLYIYIDNKYYNYYKETETEYNATIFVHVLFDNELNIKEVRNMSTCQQCENMREIDTLFVDIIKGTQGKWHFVNEADMKSSYYLVVFPYKIY